MKKIKHIIFLVFLILISCKIFSQGNSHRLNPPAVLTVTATADTICPGGTTTITANIVGGGTYTWSPGGWITSSITVRPPVTTIYTVTVIQGKNQYRDSIKILVEPLEIPFIIASKDSICAGDTLTLSVVRGTAYRWSPGGKTTDTIHISPANSITYTAYTHNQIGCVDSSSININVIPPVTAAIKAVPDTICISQTAALTIMANGGPATYKWNTGTTTSTILVSPSVNTTYSATVYGLCDSVRMTVGLTVEVCAGINRISIYNQLLVFPNPGKGYFSIDISNISENCFIEIYNVLGERVLAKTFYPVEGGNIINMSSQPPGVYLYRVLKQDNSLVGEGKLMVE